MLDLRHIKKYSLLVIICMYQGGNAFQTSHNESFLVVTPSNKKLYQGQNVAIDWTMSAFARSDKHTEQTESHFALDYGYSDKNESSERYLNFIAGLYPALGMTYIAMPEAYYLTHLYSAEYQTELSLSAGRRYKTLSQLDKSFNMGVMTPYYTQDHVHFKDQGLIGFTGEFKKSFFEFNVGFYPVFLPNQGPSYREQNGKLIFANRWAQNAPETFMFNEEARDINYTISSYNLYDIASNAGYGTGFKVGHLDENGFEFAANYLNTPINDVVISRETYADIDLMGHVVIDPVVRYSDKYSADLTLRLLNDYKLTFSYLQDKPKNRLEKNYHAVQTFENISGYSAHLQLPVFNILKRDFSVALTYAKFEGGGITDLDTDGGENTFTFSDSRLKYREPAKLDVQMKGFSLVTGKPLDVRMSWLYDVAQEASLFSAGVQMQATHNLFLALSADILGVKDEYAAMKESLFIRDHKSDDRITGDIRYVF